jgi:RNA polymerase sigma factor (sigma-70 family)
MDETRLHSGPALEALYQSQWARLVRSAWLMTGSRETAEDLVQDAFLALERSWSTVLQPEAYLYRSVLNGVRGRARRQQVVARHPPETDGPVFNPEIDEIWRLLHHLPVRQRHAVVLRYYEDMTVDEIARVLECRPGTAKSLIHRGLNRLEELLT